MSANAALKEQTYTVDAGDPVTTAGVAIIRAQKTGELAKAFGRPEIARRKVAEKLKTLGHQYDIDAMCLEALERYVEEHGEVPNATKVIASAQILDHLPEAQFDSGHRVVFAINEDGTDFIGASEMGLAIAPGGSTTTSRKGKVDERFGKITKQTLWIMIDFPEKTELAEMEAEQEKAFAAVAEVIADPATAAENFDEIIAQVQELGEVTDMSPADVAATIQTIANVVQAHAIATEAHKIVEAGVHAPDSPQITGMTSVVENMAQQVAQQLAVPDVPGEAVAKPDAIVPPVIAEMAQAVMETVQPPQIQQVPAPTSAAESAVAQTPATPAAPAAMPSADTSVQTPAMDRPVVASPVAQSVVPDMAQPVTAPVEAPVSAPQTVTPTPEAPKTPAVEAGHAAIDASSPAPVALAQDTPATIEENAAPKETLVSAEPKTDMAVAPVLPTSPIQTSAAPMETSGPAASPLKSEATIATPQAFDAAPPPAALAAQVVAIAAQIPPAQQTALTNTVMKQVATAIKNDQPVIAPLQKQVEAVIAKMPDSPAKQDLARVVETIKVTQQMQQTAPASTAKQEAPTQKTPAQTTPAAASPIVAKQAFAAPAQQPNSVAPAPVPQPRNDNDNAPSIAPTNKGSAPTIVTPPTNSGPSPVTTPSNPQPVPTGGRGPDAPPVVTPPTDGPRPVPPSNPPAPPHDKGPDQSPPKPAPSEGPRYTPDNDPMPTHGGGGGYEPPKPDIPKQPEGPENKIPSHQPPYDFQKPKDTKCPTCPSGGDCTKCFANAITEETVSNDIAAMFGENLTNNSSQKQETVPFEQKVA